jgi:hypothetical protein
MKNSFLIKNANPSFEKSYSLLRKRQLEKERAGLSGANVQEQQVSSF